MQQAFIRKFYPVLVPQELQYIKSVSENIKKIAQPLTTNN